MPGRQTYPAATMLCPVDDGSHFDATFRYSGLADRHLKIQARGCQAVFLNDSPQPAAWAVNQPSLYGFLNNILGAA